MPSFFLALLKQSSAAGQVAEATRVQVRAANIQAVAAIASLCVTIILAWLTGRYVRLTKKIADSNAEQVDMARDSAEEARLQNVASCKVFAGNLLNAIGNLSQLAPVFDELRRLKIQPHDVAQLQLYARALGVDAIRQAGIAAAGLNRIGALAERISEIPESRGWTAQTREQQMWVGTVPETIAALADVIGHADRSLAALARQRS